MTRALTRDRRTRLALALAVVVALAAGSLAAYAAARKPSFSLSSTSAPLSVAPGQETQYKVKVKPIGRFRGAVTFTVSKLPKGATARWTLPNGRRLPRARRGGGSVLARGKSGAVLVVRTGRATPPGKFRPVIKAVSGRIRRTRKLTLEVRAPAQHTLGLFAAPGARDLLQGDRTSFALTIARGGGFEGPVSLAVSGLPGGVTASFEPGASVGAATATVTFDASRDAPVGSHSVVVTAEGGGLTASAPVTVVVKETKPFAIAGDVPEALLPGVRRGVDLVLTNPHDFDLKVIALDVSVAATDRAGCAAAENFRVTPLSASLPLTVPPGTRSLSALGVPHERLPHLELLASADPACQGARVELGYRGTASR